MVELLNLKGGAGHWREKRPESAGRQTLYTFHTYYHLMASYNTLEVLRRAPGPSFPASLPRVTFYSVAQWTTKLHFGHADLTVSNHGSWRDKCQHFSTRSPLSLSHQGNPDELLFVRLLRSVDGNLDDPRWRKMSRESMDKFLQHAHLC